MKKLFLLFLMLPILFEMAYSQGFIESKPKSKITIRKPRSGDRWFLGNKYTISWKREGLQFARVKIRLFDSTGTTKIMNIIDTTANDGSFAWTIPNTVASGNYVIRVRTKDNLIFDNSDIFIIKKGLIQTGNIQQISLKGKVKVNKPAGYSNWQEGTTQIIKWDNKYTKKKTVKIHLYKANGTTFIKNIKTLNYLAKPGMTFMPDKYSWSIPNGTYKAPGTYKIRVSANNGLIDGFSPTFRISMNTVKKTYYIKASRITNKRRRKREYTTGEYGINCEPSVEVQGNDRIRVGYENRWDSNKEFYCGFFYRSRVYFDIKHLQGKGFILNAKITHKRTHGSNCQVKAWFLERHYDNILNATGPYISNTNSINLSLISKWYYPDGNFGLLFTGPDESLSHNNNGCVTIAYDVYLILTILERVQ